MAPSHQQQGPTWTLPPTHDRSPSHRPEAQHESNQRPQSFLQSTMSPPSRPRLLTVDQALQFSPLSSIVPFSPGKYHPSCNDSANPDGRSSDVIPAPNSNLPGPTSVFSSPTERQTARQPLEDLNQELSRNQGRSSAATRAEHDLKALLDSDTITGL